MVGFDFLIDPATKALGNFAISTAKSGAGKLAAEVEKAFFQASRKYIETYQKRHCQLKVLGMREPVDLSAVYTGVKLLNERDILDFDPGALEETYKQTRLRGYSGRRDDEKYPGIEIANQKQYLMVLGGPGAGKSTFLRKVGLEALQTLYYEAADYRPRLIPVLLELKRFEANDIDVAKCIVGEFETCGFPQTEDLVQKALAQGNLLILLDGLDEVPSAHLDNVLNEIRDFVDRYDKNRFIASCRVAASGYRSDTFQRFSNVTMADFDDEQIEQFITNWFSAQSDIELKTAKKCWEVLQKSKNAASKELAHTPLLLTYLCLVYNQSQRFPNNRSSLYRKALRILLEEWAAEKRILRDDIYEDLSIEQEEILLSEIAYEGMMSGQLFFSKRDLSRQIREFLSGTLNVPASLDSEKVLNAIEVQQGILVERAEDAYSFSHLTLQEYLAAQYLVDNGEWHKLVQQQITGEQWREIFLLLPGLMSGQNSTDRFLLAVEKRAKIYIYHKKVRALIAWVDQATIKDTNITSKSLAKKVLTTFLLLFCAILRDLDSVKARIQALCIDDYDNRDAYSAARIELREHILMRVNAQCFALEKVTTFAQALNHRISDIPDFKADFECFLEFSNSYASMLTDKDLSLIAYLDNTSKEHHHSSIDEKENIDHLEKRYYEFWFSTIGIEPEIASLSEEESKDLTNYLYICELMIRCKEGAVRVSPNVWAGIESRILTVPPDSQSKQTEAAPS